MNTHIALLRAINVGGKNLISMAELRELLGGLGLADVRTLLQSGNVVFRSGHTSGPELERLLETAVMKQCQLSIHVIVRTPEQVDETVQANPFPGEAASNPSRLAVLFLRSAPPDGCCAALRAAYAGPESFELRGRELYVYYPNGMGESKLTGSTLEKHLACKGTARNWNTVLKLRDLAESWSLCDLSGRADAKL